MSYQHRIYSDEHLNAFIDNQLDKSERTEVLNDLRNDRELSHRVCELEKVRSLIHLTYQTVDIPESCQDNSKKPSRFHWAAAAAVLLCVGALFGSLITHSMSRDSLLDLAKITQPTQAISGQKQWNLMLHVSTADPHRLDVLLDEAEALLKEYSKNGKKLNLEILTNSKGLKLVSNNGEPYNKRLMELQKKYKNLVTLACNETLQRLKRETGKDIHLQPKTRVVPSALTHIIERQREGWTYVHI